MDPTVIGAYLSLATTNAKVVYIFTPEKTQLHLHGKTLAVIPLTAQLNSIAGLLAQMVFTGKLLVIAWDVKPILSLLKRSIPDKLYAMLCLDKMVDLKIA